MIVIERVSSDGAAKVNIHGQIVTVHRGDYLASGWSTPAERDAGILRAAQYKLKYGDA